MKMQPRESIVLPLAILSVLTSFMFIYYGLGILNTESAPDWTKVYAYVALGYGLGNIYILSWAWRTGGTWGVWADKLIAFCFFGVFIIDRWRTGIESRLEVVGILGMAGILWLNWLAVKKLSHRGG